MTLIKKHFKQQLSSMLYSYKLLRSKTAEDILTQCLETIRHNGSIIVSGLGKNVPICEKFVGTLTSVGIRSYFMHTNSAIHGDLGMISPNDLVIVLSKSGETVETLFLCQTLVKKQSTNWVITCAKNTTSEHLLKQSVILRIKNEGDPWNLLPNNSSLVFLMFLQSLAMSIIKKMAIPLSVFKENHPGGSIGKALNRVLPESNISYLSEISQVRAFDAARHFFRPGISLSFDLDGTLIGRSLPPIPHRTFLKLSRNFKTILVTGAGLKSVKTKISKHYHQKSPKHTLTFSGPVIVNEGAQIYSKFKATTKSKLIYQSPLSPQSLQYLSKIIAQKSHYNFVFGFYPPYLKGSSQHKNYYLFSANHQKATEFLKAKPQSILIPSRLNFIDKLQSLGAVKFIIQPEPQTSPNTSHPDISVVENEGVVNITSSQSTKLQGLMSLDQLCQIKINPENLIHFGNDINDYPVLAFSSFGVIVNTDPSKTKQLVTKLQNYPAHHYLVLSPNLMPAFLKHISKISR